MTMRAAWAHSSGTSPAGVHAAHFGFSQSPALRRGLALSLALHAVALPILGVILARTMPPSPGQAGERLVRVRLLAPAAPPRHVPAPVQPRAAAVAPAQLPPPRHDTMAPARPQPPEAAERAVPPALVAPPRASPRAAPPDAICVAVVAEATGVVVSLPAPEETGGAVYDNAPTPSHVIKPVYPLGARQRGEEGSLEAELLVEADGSVGVATVRRSSGFADLDRAAISALRAARFTPARRRGRPVAARIRITVVFRLTDA
jgi:protein TonB